MGFTHPTGKLDNMKTFKFKKIDAFATENSSGNPAGMIWLNSFEDIAPDEMQQIARELKGFVSEVGFIRQLEDNDFELKYYSSEREVDFCGHATIAIMYDLIKTNDHLSGQEYFDIKTPKGNLIVENRITEEDAVFISAPAPVFSGNKIDKEPIAKALNLQPDMIHSKYPISIINAGLETLLVPIKDLSGTLSLSPEIDTLQPFCIENKIDIVTVFTDDVADKNNAFRTRVFAPTFGYLEDPATGSGNSALGSYLLKNSLWDATLMSVEQNGSFDNPNIVKLSAKKSGRKDIRIMFGGSAVTRIDGAYKLW